MLLTIFWNKHIYLFSYKNWSNIWEGQAEGFIQNEVKRARNLKFCCKKKNSAGVNRIVHVVRRVLVLTGIVYKKLKKVIYFISHNLINRNRVSKVVRVLRQSRIDFWTFVWRSIIGVFVSFYRTGSGRSK